VLFNGSTQSERGRVAFRSYLKWERQSSLQIASTEVRLVSEKHQFGGTMDALIVDGDLSICDFKTSKSVYESFLIQIAAYKILWEEAHPERPITGGFHLLKFSKLNGDFAHHYYDALPEAEEAFLLMRRLYDITKNLKQRV